MEIDEESEPEVPVYNRAELIERYQVRAVFRSRTVVNIKGKKFQDLERFLRPEIPGATLKLVILTGLIEKESKQPLLCYQIF